MGEGTEDGSGTRSPPQLGAGPAGLGELLAEFRRRRVFRVVLGYGIFCFAVLQVIEPIMHGAHLPDWVLTAVLVALAVGFPVAVILGWVYDLTAQGVVRTLPRAGAPALSRGRVALYLAGLGLVAALPGMGWLALRHPAAAPAATVARAQAGSPAAPSIAVLPFADMSPGHDQAYFADGVAEEILNALAHVEGLRVPGRTSSFWFKGKDVELAEIGRKLSVTHVLEGSVRRAGKRLRVTAQVVGVADGYHLWSETFDRPEADVFAVQDEVARAVVEALRTRLQLGPAAAPAPARTTTAEVHDLVLLGLDYRRRAATTENLRRETEAFEKAVALDPGHARAWAALSEAVGRSGENSPTLAGVLDAKKRELAAAERAIALAPDLADGYRARGGARQTSGAWDFAGALADLDRAQALSPSDADVLRVRGNLLKVLGRLPEALAALRQATAVDPLSGRAWISLGQSRVVAGDLAGARADLERARALVPDGVHVWFTLGEISLLEGRPAEALEAFQRVPEETWRITGEAMALHELGRVEEAGSKLKRLTARYGHSMAFQIAEVEAWRGDADAAFDWLARADRQLDGGLAELKIDPLLRRLHGTPRFTALLRRLNLPVD